MSSFTGQVYSEFKTTLDDLSFQLIEDTYDEECFGNSVLVFRSKEFRLRFIRDRGQIFIDIGAASYSKWYSLEEVLNVLNHHVQINQENVLETSARELKAIYPQLKEMFKEQNLLETDTAIQELRHARLAIQQSTKSRM
jgi:hypothetical protein